MKNFRTYQLALDFYKQSKQLKLKGAIRDQYERASLSVVLNLAEGSAKPTRKDRRKFYFIAFGSIKEIQAILDIIEDQRMIESADKLAAHIYKLGCGS